MKKQDCVFCKIIAGKVPVSEVYRDKEIVVVNASSIPHYDAVPYLLYWFLPTIIGTPLIKRVVKKYS